MDQLEFVYVEKVHENWGILQLVIRAFSPLLPTSITLDAKPHQGLVFSLHSVLPHNSWKLPVMHTHGSGCSVPDRYAEPCQLTVGRGRGVTGKERVSRRCPVGWTGEMQGPL